MTKPKDIAVLVGSLRRDSINRKAARALIELAPPELSLETIEIGELPHYNEDFDRDAGSTPATYTAFRKRLASADGFLFLTPEYNRSLPGVLKNAIDVGSRPYGHSIWQGKPAAIISLSLGALGGFGANHHLRQALVGLDVPTMQQPEAYIGGGDKLFDAEGRLAMDSTRRFLQQYLERFAAWTDRHAA